MWMVTARAEAQFIPPEITMVDQREIFQIRIIERIISLSMDLETGNILLMQDFIMINLYWENLTRIKMLSDTEVMRTMSVLPEERM